MNTQSLSQLKGWSLLLSGAMLIGGCGPSADKGDKAPVDTTAPSTPTVSKTPEAEVNARSSTGPAVKPPKGFGNAQGRVLWNEKAAPGIDVRLCENTSMMGCSGKTYSAKTDKDGNYTIDKVPPGDYGLTVRLFSTDAWVYPTTGILTAARFHIDEGKTLDIRVTNLYKTDLKIASPKAGETVKSGSPQLTWQAYDGASQYEVTLTGESGSSETIKTAETSAKAEQPLLNGAYKWKVSAFNANGVRIAETNDSSPFKVVGQAGSSKVELTNPRNASSVSGSGLKFTWKAHPLANGYQIYLNPVAGKGAILAFENVDGTSHTLTQPLPAGKYYWSINAMRDGKKIAASELQNFSVK